MARMEDVAAAAGVSKTTVSYVFSPQKSALISPETREKVLSIAAKLGYKPSFFGKVLSEKRSFNIALILPSRTAQSMSRTLLQIFHGIVHNAETSDYNVSVFFGVGKRFFNRSGEGRFDGVIVIGLGSDTAALDKISALNLPMVVVNRQYPISKKCSCIHSDIAGWFKCEVDRMLENGCRNLLFLNKGLHTDSGKSAAEIFPEVEKQVTAAGGVIEQIFAEKNISLQVNELLQHKHYDGMIINSSDGAAVLDALKLHKLQPNLDIQLSGFVRDPALCMFGFVWEADSVSMGRQGWNMLMELLNGSKGKHTVLPIAQYSKAKTTGADFADGFDV